ncbi:hypothetical protein [Paenibacillus sp. CECT 9249]|uniref:hypothetical protein n=1 Tax=Paenibacillus sp. CECT 9249 TaxID=2845385 RepID=UPI001E4FA379|nr:hypothetical protein [Paenibacillus sp. CECT 9249]
MVVIIAEAETPIKKTTTVSGTLTPISQINRAMARAAMTIDEKEAKKRNLSYDRSNLNKQIRLKEDR